MLEILTGYKTYIAAALAFAAAGYEVLVAGNMERGFEYFIAGLGLAGLRSAIPTKV